MQAVHHSQSVMCGACFTALYTYCPNFNEDSLICYYYDSYKLLKFNVHIVCFHSSTKPSITFLTGWQLLIPLNKTTGFTLNNARYILGYNQRNIATVRFIIIQTQKTYKKAYKCKTNHNAEQKTPVVGRQVKNNSIKLNDYIPWGIFANEYEVRLCVVVGNYSLYCVFLCLCIQGVVECILYKAEYYKIVLLLRIIHTALGGACDPSVDFKRR